MTIFIDDAGSGDILWGVVIGVYRPESDIFIYDLIDVSFFKTGILQEKNHLNAAAKITLSLVERLFPEPEEKIMVCQGDIINQAAEVLREKYGEERIDRVCIKGRAQTLIEAAYTDELRNLGYEPIPERTNKWGKSFWHMYEWVKRDMSRIKYVKTGFPNLRRYRIFKQG